MLRPKPYSAALCKNCIHIYFSSLSTLMSYVSPVWFRFSCCLFPCVRSGSARQGFLHRESQSSQFSFENPGNVPSPGLPNLMHFHNSYNVLLWQVLITKACSILSYSIELFFCVFKSKRKEEPQKHVQQDQMPSFLAVVTIK